MSSIPKKRRGLASALGLTLLALLAFGAFAASAAQASPTWKRSGVPFGGTFPFQGESSAGGAFTLEAPGLGLEVSCQEEVSGQIESYDDVQFTSTLTGCDVVDFEEVCTVAGPASATFQGWIGEPLSAGGDHYAMEFEGEECPFLEVPISVPSSLGFSLRFGKEAQDLPVTMSAKGNVNAGGPSNEPAIFSSSSEWTLIGGGGWSFGPTGEPPAETWKIDNTVLGGFANVQGQSSTGSAFTLEVPGLGLDVSCHEAISGTLEAYDDVQFTSTLTGCSIAGFDEVCSIAEPVSATFQGKVSESLIPGGKHFAMDFEGEECPFIEVPISAPHVGFSLDLGEEAVNLPVTMSAKGNVDVAANASNEPAVFSSTLNWHLTGPEKGLSFGVS